MKWVYVVLWFVIPVALFVYLVAPGKVHTPSQRGSIAGGAGMF